MRQVVWTHRTGFEYGKPALFPCKPPEHEHVFFHVEARFKTISGGSRSKSNRDGEAPLGIERYNHSGIIPPGFPWVNAEGPIPLILNDPKSLYQSPSGTSAAAPIHRRSRLRSTIGNCKIAHSLDLLLPILRFNPILNEFGEHPGGTEFSRNAAIRRPNS